MQKNAPIWVVIVVQIFSVIGDCFGQRCSRVHYKFSRRHMIIGFSLMSALQMFVVMTILQLSLPTSITGAIYYSGVRSPCYQELDVEGKNLNCTSDIHYINNTLINNEVFKIEKISDNPLPLVYCHEIPCKSQGPFSMFRSIALHPTLLLNGVLNILYYTGEVLLYREPLGLVFLVLASLTSTFLINPFNIIFREPINQPIPPLIYVLGIVGCIFCVVEKEPAPKKSNIITSPKFTKTEGSVTVINDQRSMSYESQPLLSFPNETSNQTTTKSSVFTVFKRTAKIIPPFVLLSVCYALWFETSKFFNDQFRVNAFGYNSIDQILLPFYTLSFLSIIDFITPFKRCYESPEDQKENILQAFKSTWKETKLIDLFLYRFFINGRAFVYFYLDVFYDLTEVYLELTLIRVVLSWLAALLVGLAFPKFIQTSVEEKNRVFSPFNIGLKVIGSIAITAAIVLLNY
eukprot:TRINITY_DN432_c0_g2_i1.p1 TRINITY_DN432_c0_g2~~TRINITY_DN432_c0_g2_i1.p1  ORF type:complete len:460 (+),score=47.24 TRINITY_DN432_c0_g2_i1:215-1594(+)